MDRERGEGRGGEGESIRDPDERRMYGVFG